MKLNSGLDGPQGPRLAPTSYGRLRGGGRGSPGTLSVTVDQVSLAMSNRAFCKDGNVPYVRRPMP